MKCNDDKCPPEELLRINHLVAGLPSDEGLYQDVELLKALSDITRLKIVHLLREGELCVCGIMHALDKPQSTVSHHLNLLKNTGLVEGRKEGIWTRYQLTNPRILECMEDLTKAR